MGIWGKIDRRCLDALHSLMKSLVYFQVMNDIIMRQWVLWDYHRNNSYLLILLNNTHEKVKVLAYDGTCWQRDKFTGYHKHIYYLVMVIQLYITFKGILNSLYCIVSVASNQNKINIQEFWPGCARIFLQNITFI